eukprot:960755-Rhodomonas_salina.2
MCIRDRPHPPPPPHLPPPHAPPHAPPPHRVTLAVIVIGVGIAHGHERGRTGSGPRGSRAWPRSPTDTPIPYLSTGHPVPRA